MCVCMLACVGGAHTQWGSLRQLHDRSCDKGRTWPTWHFPEKDTGSLWKMNSSLYWLTAQGKVSSRDKQSGSFSPCSPWERCVRRALCEPDHVCSWTPDPPGPRKRFATPSLGYNKQNKTNNTSSILIYQKFRYSPAEGTLTISEKWNSSTPQNNMRRRTIISLPDCFSLLLEIT